MCYALADTCKYMPMPNPSPSHTGNGDDIRMRTLHLKVLSTSSRPTVHLRSVVLATCETKGLGRIRGNMIKA